MKQEPAVKRGNYDVQDELANSHKECGHLKLQVTQLAHSLRECEKRLEKTREQLSASISKEERFHTRGKQAYTRIRAAWASAKGTSKAAGAIATASREMRPVEIVSIYEDQKAQVYPDFQRIFHAAAPRLVSNHPEQISFFRAAMRHTAACAGCRWMQT